MAHIISWLVMGALSLFSGGSHFGAPTANVLRTILPESSDTYTVGATSTRWVAGYFDNIYDVGGNKYSTSSGGGSGSVSTSSAITANYFPFWATTGGALSGTSTIYASTTRIGIGTTAPSTTLHVIGDLKVSATTTIQGNLLDVSGNKYSTSTGGGAGSVTTSSAPTAFTFPYWANTTGGLMGTSSLYFSSTTGVLGINGLTSSFPALINNGATLDVKTADNGGYTAVHTGALQVSGYPGFNIDTYAALRMTDGSREIVFQSGTNGVYGGVKKGVTIGSSLGYIWGTDDTPVSTGACDTGLSRNAAGIVEVNNCTSGTLADLKVRALTTSGLVTLTASSSVETPSIGGGLLTAATCASATTTVDSTITSSTAAFDTTPQNYPGDGIVWDSYLSAAGLITTRVCAIATLTPTATKYNVKILK